MVEVSDQLSGLASNTEGSSAIQAASIPPITATQIPGIDPDILNHAATDFELPTYYETYETSPPSETSPITGEPLKADEVSDQFRNYNVNSSYHR